MTHAPCAQHLCRLYMVCERNVISFMVRRWELVSFARNFCAWDLHGCKGNVIRPTRSPHYHVPCIPCQTYCKQWLDPITCATVQLMTCLHRVHTWESQVPLKLCSWYPGGQRKKGDSGKTEVPLGYTVTSRPARAT